MDSAALVNSASASWAATVSPRRRQRGIVILPGLRHDRGARDDLLDAHILGVKPQKLFPDGREMPLRVGKHLAVGRGCEKSLGTRRHWESVSGPSGRPV